MKRCHCCEQVKPLESFCLDRRRNDGRLCACRDCAATKRKAVPRDKMQAYQNRWRSKNGDRVRQKNRERYAKDPLRAKQIQQKYHATHKDKIAVKRRAATLKQYGLIPHQYEAMLAAQGGTCAICHALDPGHWSGRFQVDHDHVSGAVRGLLCSACNGGLGLFKDDVERLRQAMRSIVHAVGHAPRATGDGTA